jgi:hypothetical protein
MNTMKKLTRLNDAKSDMQPNSLDAMFQSKIYGGIVAELAGKSTKYTSSTTGIKYEDDKAGNVDFGNPL